MNGVKVFSVLSQSSSDTCEDSLYVRLLGLQRNNLGHAGPDSGDEGIRYHARLGGKGAEPVKMIVELHVTSENYTSPDPKNNGLWVGRSGKDLGALCNATCDQDAMNFGAISHTPGKETNISLSFYDEQMTPAHLDGISVTWFDLDHDTRTQSSHAMESVTPGGNYTAYVSKDTTVRHGLKDSVATFSGWEPGAGSDNPVNSRFASKVQMRKAVTAVYGRVHTIQATLRVSAGPDSPRMFFFDFVPSLLCAKQVDEWPAWPGWGVSGHGDQTLAPTTTSTATTTATTTTTFHG
jgi:hypothetical protein